MAVLSTLMLLTACGTLSPASDEPTAALGQVNAYKLAPGDKLKVNVFNETDLSGEYQITDRGDIAFPLVGEIQAAGLSAEELRVSLTNALRKGFVRSPSVTVEVVNYRPINVVGEVRNAGQYAYRPGISIHDAIAMAGGYTYRANPGVVYVTRGGGSAEQVEVDLKRKDEMQVLPGDNIRIPERYF